jgi:hypothetical protein
MSRCLHPHSHADSCLLQIAVELLCFSLSVFESPLTEFSHLRVHKRNFLNARVVIATYNQHIGSFLLGLGLVDTTKSTQVQGADIVMKSLAPHISH